MASTGRRYSKEEFSRRGGAIYEKDIHPQLTAKDDGKFLAIDIETGEFAIDADELVPFPFSEEFYGNELYRRRSAGRRLVDWLDRRSSRR